MVLLLIGGRLWAQGSGLAPQTGSIRRAGMADAGLAATDEAGIMVYNPGGLPFVRRPQIQAGLMVVGHSTAFKGASLQPAFTQTPLRSPLATFVLLQPSEDSPLRFGLGGFQPYTCATRWEPNWVGGAAAQAFALTSANVTAAAAMRLNSKIAIGLNWQLAPVGLLMQRALPFATTDMAVPVMTLSGRANAQAWGAGVYFRPLSRLALAVSWRSSVRLRMAGSVATNVPASVQSLFPATQFTTVLHLPGQLQAGAQLKAGELLALSFDVGLLLARSFDSLVVDFDQNSTQQRDIAEFRDWRNALFLRVGGEYNLSGHWALRAGLAFEGTPVPNTRLYPDIPEASRVVCAAGATWQLSRWFAATFSYRLALTGNRTASLQSANLAGTYRSNEAAAGVSLVYFFR